MATQLEVECPVCKRTVKLIGNAIIPLHRNAKKHRQCAASQQAYRDYPCNPEPRESVA